MQAVKFSFLVPRVHVPSGHLSHTRAPSLGLYEPSGHSRPVICGSVVIRSNRAARYNGKRPFKSYLVEPVIQVILPERFLLFVSFFELEINEHCHYVIR